MVVCRVVWRVGGGGGGSRVRAVAGEKGGPLGGPPFVVVWRRCPTLPHPGGCSTIGAGSLSFRVRKGKVRACPCRYDRRHAVPGCHTPPGRQGGVGFGYRIADADRFDPPPALPARGGLCWVGRPISAGRLHSLAGRPRPVYQPRRLRGAFPPRGWWRTRLEAGFPLRCFQRLSLPNVANQPCSWRNNWHTRGSSVPVLSYWGQPFSILLRAQRIGTELSHDVLNPARVPL